MDLLFNSDVLLEIFNFLNIEDLLNVSLVSRSFHQASKPLLYSKLYLKWTDIDSIATAYETNEVDERVQFAKIASIEADGRGEWVSSRNLAALGPASNFNLRELHISCALHSSGWLKYLSAPLYDVKLLKLTRDVSFQSYSFDFEHIARTLPNLEMIELGDTRGGFTIDPYSDGRLESLSSIRVFNCDWQYPLMLTDAAINGELENLEIFYTEHMHPFAFSERLKAQCSNLPRFLKSLKVSIDVGMPLNWNPLQHTKPLAELEKAEFQGFSFKYSPTLKSNSATKFPKLKELIEI